MKTRLDVNGAEIEASTIQSISGNASVDAVIHDITIEQIVGEINLRSRLERGKLRLSFSPHFEIRVERTEIQNAGVDNLVKKLVDAGLSEAQARKAVDIFGAEPFDLEVGEIEGRDSVIVSEDTSVAVPGTKDGRTLDIPLPNFPLNLDPKIDLRNFQIDDVRVGGKTTLTAENIGTEPAKLADFSVIMDVPEAIAFKKAQLDEPGVKPIEIPEFNAPDLRVPIDIPRLGTSEIPLAMQSTTGGADIHVRLLDWHPRWGVRWCISIGPFHKCLVIEFGVNLTIDLDYRWSISLLKVAISIRNAFLNRISITVELANTALTRIKIGLFSALRVVLQHM